MVVPTYLGTMALGGGMAGATMTMPQYQGLLMSSLQNMGNMGNMGGSIASMGLQMPEHSSYPGTAAYQGFPTRLPLPSPQVLQQASVQKTGDSSTGQETVHQPVSTKSFTPEPSDQQSPPPAVALEEANAVYLAELEAEKEKMESSEEAVREGGTNHLLRLLETEIQQVQGGGGRSSGQREQIKYFDIYRERPVRLTVRALIPVREHPKFNFVGKLLGPKGNSMKRLQEETMTKMAVLGRGSMRDKQKEEELRSSADPKYQHLAEDLHVEITAFAPPAEAHARIAYALTEVRKYLIPDSNDEIRQEQMREMELISTNGDVIDSLKAGSPQLLLHPFPGQLQAGQAPNPPVLHTSPHLATSSTFLAAPFLTTQATLPSQDLPDRPDQEMPTSCSPQDLPSQPSWGLKAPPTYHSSAQRSAAACPYSKPA